VWVVYHRKGGEETFYKTLTLDDSQIETFFGLYKQDRDSIVVEEGKEVKRLLTSRFEIVALKYAPQIEVIK